MRCKQAMEAVITRRAALSLEADTLEDDVAVRIGKHELLNDVSSITRRVLQQKGRDAPSTGWMTLTASRFSSEK
jgi:hypothetical protein